MILSTNKLHTRLQYRLAIGRITLALPLPIVIGLAVLACRGEPPLVSPPTPGPALKVKVVTTTSILADLVRNVGGPGVEVQSIVPSGTDVHSFQSTPKDSIAIAKARVIVSNGYGLDSLLDSVIRSAKSGDAVHLVAAEGLNTQAVEGENVEAPIGGDPHLWLNPLHVVRYVERIRDALTQADPANAQLYQANSASYIQKLRQIDQEIAQTLEAVPRTRRHLVTFHSAFGYFAKRYGWRFSSFVPGDAADVTPGAVTRIMERLREESIPAVFAEPQFNSAVLRQIAKDAGVTVGVLYSDATDANAHTYLDMMKFNARSLVEHLR